MKLSIIIPIFNAEHTIERAIRSIDTEVSHEIICVNDGSTDDSLQVINKIARENLNIKVINQDNQGAAAARNHGLEQMTGDVFMFLDADDEFLTCRIDHMLKYYEKHEDVEIVIGQMAREEHGTWVPIPTHQAIREEKVVNLSEYPEIMQSIGPGAKLFSQRFKDLRFDTDVTFCEEHTFIVQAFKKARDIQIIPNLIYGYNLEANSVTASRVGRFEEYLHDAQTVRSRVMEILRLPAEKLYYSYRMDHLIVSYLIQNYLTEHRQLTRSIVEKVIHYIKHMNSTDYDGGALFRIVDAVEQAGTGWTKDIYSIWREGLINTGIGRPHYYIFKAKVLPKKVKFSSKQKAKKILKR
ncbi:glycosyltransferase family 2 protein [Staphylococcus sp. SQ8-PEA]|uniref:Glycosyltransferase family 2 protein n=1 Tax=Staphylococcus marylandisciuri TaxID=2981529 RepID=A0ABT2QSE8_9STAP|nr:glycosyltransferase family A protein [Staphylococcus marylandisciuri]MCU5746916.1 glycosyltransferase family 2 protein [Staphylococcus marylandisciuri]